MKSLKSIFYWTSLAILLAIFIAPSPVLTGKCSGKSHNATFGSKRPGDKLLFKDHIVEKWRFLGFARREIIFPLKGEKRKYIITEIKLTDRYKNGHGGCPEIKEGGVNNDHVKINIKSEFTRGFDFDIEIYGLKKSKARKLKY
uniref:Venom protein family 3 protein 2 n=1 Tax=Platymeris rhadamanthus TaxID=1134088 RepID=A0A6B9KZ24_PLARH|nr:venom protein family 3 protein 2 [Platymeris rhadamanthus]